MGDEDYLKPHYDVIISGTGLVESIISCAASRSGLEVLHLDRNDYYGSQNATFNLKDFLSLGSTPQTEALEGGNDADPKPFLGFKRAIPLRDRQEKPAHPAVTNESNNSTAEADGEEAPSADTQPQRTELELLLETKFRRFSLDLNVKFLFAAGSSVDYFVKSGVANYLEFKSIEGITYVDKNEVCVVPSSKNDMFNSKFFSLAEKRIMNKFLHFVNDYGRAAAGTDLMTINEKQLAQGRSLHRPQNKGAFNANEFDVDSFLDRPFKAFMTHSKITPRLQTIIIHALCFHIRDADDLDTKTALDLLSTHLNATGRFGGTAILWPIYGASEIPQAFCRMSAVWGAVFLLRTGVKEVTELDEPCKAFGNRLLESSKEEARSSEEGEEGNSNSSESANNCAANAVDSACSNAGAGAGTGPTSVSEGPERAVVADGDNVVTSTPNNNNNRLLQVTLTSGKTFTCNAFVSSCDDLADIALGSHGIASPCFEVTSVLINCSAVVSLPPDSDTHPFGKYRGIEIFPPQVGGVGNPHAMYFVQTDASCQVCAEGTALIHVVTMVDVVEGGAAPVIAGASAANENEISWDAYIDQQQHELAQLMERALDVLSTLHAPNLKFIAQKMFVQPLFKDPLANTGSIPAGNDAIVPANIGIVGESNSRHHISTDDSLRQASALFSHLFPGRVFMQQPELDENFGHAHGDGSDAQDDEMEYLARTLQAVTATEEQKNTTVNSQQQEVSAAERTTTDTQIGEECPAPTGSGECDQPEAAESNDQGPAGDQEK